MASPQNAGRRGYGGCRGSPLGVRRVDLPTGSRLASRSSVGRRNCPQPEMAGHRQRCRRRRGCVVAVVRPCLRQSGAEHGAGDGLHPDPPGVVGGRRLELTAEAGARRRLPPAHRGAAPGQAWASCRMVDSIRPGWSLPRRRTRLQCVSSLLGPRAGIGSDPRAVSRPITALPSGGLRRTARHRTVGRRASRLWQRHHAASVSRSMDGDPQPASSASRFSSR